MLSCKLVKVTILWIVEVVTGKQSLADDWQSAKDPPGRQSGVLARTNVSSSVKTSDGVRVELHAEGIGDR
jgi:hypothetical protein